PTPREFDAPDPSTRGFGRAMEERRALEAAVERLRSLVAGAEAHLRRTDNFWDRALGGDSRAAKVVESQGRLLNNAIRALEAFEIREFLGFDASSLARTIESGFDLVDPSRMGTSLENVIQGALVRAWITSAEMIRLQEVFGDQLEAVVEEFAKTGQLQSDVL